MFRPSKLAAGLAGSLAIAASSARAQDAPAPGNPAPPPGAQAPGSPATPPGSRAPGNPAPPAGAQTPGVPTTANPNFPGNPAPAAPNTAGPARPGVGVMPPVTGGPVVAPGAVAAPGAAVAVPPTDFIGPNGGYGVGFGGGYSQYGWGGWTGTVDGDIARGLGAMAAGAGAFNESTARAESINADTVMRFNEYLYQSQQIRNRRYYQRLAEARADRAENAETVYKRLHDSPDPRDIGSGAALNVVLDELSAPGVYLGTDKGTSEPVDRDTIRAIPFRYAAEAITISLDDFLASDPPKAFATADMKAPRQTLRDAVKAVSDEIDRDGQARPESLQAVRNAADGLWKRFDQSVPESSADRREGETYLKGIYGLARMLESPNIDEYLGKLDEKTPTNVGRLVGFMNAFNLRFGPAEKPAEVAAYNDLYPKLVATRDSVLPDKKQLAPVAAANNGPRSNRAAADFFSGMERTRPASPAATTSDGAPVPPENRPGGQPMRQPGNAGENRTPVPPQPGNAGAANPPETVRQP